MATVIDGLVESHRLLSGYLDSQKQLSLRIDSDAHFRKTLLLSAASYFETQIKDSIVTFVADYAAAAEPILEFVKNKAIERQYHTYFSWNAANANTFFGLFGGGFKEFMLAEIKAKPTLGTSIKTFLELGELRNQLVHQNFATFPLDKTVDEIYALYEKGLSFVEEFPKCLREYCARNPGAGVKS